jgi:hypothetical protein
MSRNPCFTCAEGGMACDGCLDSPQNSTPVKIYTPKRAARAMLAGKVLKGKWGLDHFWGKNKQGEIGFFRQSRIDDDLYTIYDFSGLWEEL